MLSFVQSTLGVKMVKAKATRANAKPGQRNTHTRKLDNAAAMSHDGHGKQVTLKKYVVPAGSQRSQKHEVRTPSVYSDYI